LPTAGKTIGARRATGHASFQPDLGALTTAFLFAFMIADIDCARAVDPTIGVRSTPEIAGFIEDCGSLHGRSSHVLRSLQM
jgi:hypothetical protein